MARSRSSRSSSSSSSSDGDSDADNRRRRRRSRSLRSSRSPPRARHASRSPSRDRVRTGAAQADGADDPRSRPDRRDGGGRRSDSRERGRAPRDDAHLREPARIIRGRGGNAPAGAPPPEPRERTLDAGTSKTGGAYIPPFKLAQLMAASADKEGPQYQRMTWDALRKSINGLVNKVNVSNLAHILPELFRENLVRGRGLLARSVLKSQMASPQFSGVLAALVAVVNTKLPEVGALILRRAVLQFRRAFRRNDKPVCVAATRFLAALVVQRVAHELLALELLTLLLGAPTDDSVEIAIQFVRECGYTLTDLAPAGVHGVFERLRAILHEGAIDKRTQFMIEGAFAHRKARFEGNAGIPPGLDLVEEADQVIHEHSLDDAADAEASLDVFAVDPHYVASEAKYAALRREILGEESSESGSSSGDAGDASGSKDDDDEQGDASEEDAAAAAQTMQIKDASEANLVNLRRTIYLTIMSSLDFEEAGHKLLKISLAPGQEVELCTMLVECCCQERTYLRYYGLLAGRFCFINPTYAAQFDEMFAKQYATIHRLETNKLRNVARFFAHLLSADALPWSVLAYVQLTEEATTSSSRIFVKILFQELAEQLGLKSLNERLADPAMSVYYAGILPLDSARNTRFAINFFTSIGLGGLTDGLRAALKEMPKRLAAQQAAEAAAAAAVSSSTSSSTSSGSDSSDSDSSDSSSSSSSSSSSDQPKKKKKRG